MELKTTLLLVAFQHQIHEPDFDSGLSRFVEVVGKPIDPHDFQVALACAAAAGLIHDPVQLPAGALQCHWHLGLTSKGVSKVRGLLQDPEEAADGPSL